VLYTRVILHVSPPRLFLLGCFQGFFSEQACSLVFPHLGCLILAMYRLTLPHGYFLTWFFQGFFFRSPLTGIFNVVVSPLFLTWSTPPPHFYTYRYHVLSLIFNVVFSPLFLTWSTPPPLLYTSRYLAKFRMRLAAQCYVQGGQMGGNVAAAARRPGSGKLHVSGWEGAGVAWRWSGV
jgi:hypothetical protein